VYDKESSAGWGRVLPYSCGHILTLFGTGEILCAFSSFLTVGFRLTGCTISGTFESHISLQHVSAEVSNGDDLVAMCAVQFEHIISQQGRAASAF